MTERPIVGVPIGVAMKWAPLRVEVDELTGAVVTDARFSGPSDADRAALEWGLRLGELWHAEVTVASVGPPEAAAMLRDALACGASRAVLTEVSGGGLPSWAVAAELARALPLEGVVLCGDYSVDRGSASVPAFLAARAGAAQALGLVRVEPGEPRHLLAERRLHGGRRERLALEAPAVLSVESGAARLRRATLQAVLSARSAPIEVLAPLQPWEAGERTSPANVHRSPYRPRPRTLASPDSALPTRERVLQLTGALDRREPPLKVEAEPDEAARLILDQLARWGYLPHA